MAAKKKSTVMLIRSVATETAADDVHDVVDTDHRINAKLHLSRHAFRHLKQEQSLGFLANVFVPGTLPARTHARLRAHTNAHPMALPRTRV